MRRHVMLLCLALAAATACAASDVPTAAKSATPLAGVYTLRSMNGAVLPFVYPSDSPSYAYAVTGSQLTLLDNGTWFESLGYWRTSGGGYWPTYAGEPTPPGEGEGATIIGQRSDWGTWVRAGSAVTFSWSSSYPIGKTAYTGTFDGTLTLSLTRDDITYLFTK